MLLALAWYSCINIAILGQTDGLFMSVSSLIICSNGFLGEGSENAETVEWYLVG